MPAAADGQRTHGGGTISALRRLAATGVEVAHTRLGILSNEMEEERARLGSMVMTCALALFFFFISAILFVFLVVVLLWESYRVHALSIMGGLFLLAGLIAWRSYLRQRSERPVFLAATLGELAKDRRELSSR